MRIFSLLQSTKQPTNRPLAVKGATCCVDKVGGIAERRPQLKHVRAPWIPQATSRNGKNARVASLRYSNARYPPRRFVGCREAPSVGRTLLVATHGRAGRHLRVAVESELAAA